MSDDGSGRLKRDGNHAAPPEPDFREHRGAEDRQHGRILTDEERLAIFRAESLSTHLPVPPYIPGYHTMWASTTNEFDSLTYRRRLGYDIVEPHEIPTGWERPTDKDASTPSRVTINEMVLMKLPLSLFELYMRENHHTKPLNEEAGIVRRYEGLEAEMQRRGARTFTEHDLQGYVDRRPAPRFGG